MKSLWAPVAVLLALAAAAGADPPSNADAVFVGGTPIMRVRVAAGGLSTSQRADQIQGRVNLLLGQGPIKPSDITVQPLGSEAVVRVKNQLLFTADLATAQANHEKPLQLANQWAAHMRQVLPDLTRSH